MLRYEDEQRHRLTHLETKHDLTNDELAELTDLRNSLIAFDQVGWQEPVL